MFTVIGGVMDDLNGVGGVTIQDQVLQTIIFGCGPVGTVCPGTIIIEQAGLAGVNQMGIYDLTNPATRVTIFLGPEGAGTARSFSFDVGDGSVIVGATDTNTFFGSGTSFGLFIDNGSNVFFSQDALNSDLQRHVLIFHTESGGFSSNGIGILDHSFLFAFEDLPTGAFGADFDYNDFIYNFKVPFEAPPPVIPEPSSVLLFGLGGLGSVARLRKRRAAQRA